MRSAGLIYLFAIVFVACWAGLRSAIAGCVLLIAYVWVVYTYPISEFGKDHAMFSRAIISTAVIYPLFAVVAGVVQNRLRNAAIREFDARAAADSESEHRRIVEAELWSSEEMRRLIVESSGDAIIGMSEQGAITVWNPNAQKLFGWTQAEAIGWHVSQRILTPGSRKELNVGLQRFFETRDGPYLRTHVELVAQRKSGAEILVELYIADHKTDKGTIYIGFVRDISDRKRAEQAIHILNSRLEERVAERTAQLEAANDELIGFTYSVSHDLRAPLRAIVSNSRIVCEDAKDSVDEKTLERLKRLELSALKMSELIENLLQFARIGQIALKCQEVDLSAMAQSISNDLQAVKQGSVSVQPEMVLQGDPEMIKMVLFNLMENAWKYTQSEHSPEVEVGATSDNVFFVRDHGIGFDMQYVDKIWEPFERLHRDSEYPGTGIGLANSRRIIARHGGRMWAEAAPGKGTTIYFQLPDARTVTADKRRAAEYVS